MALSKAHKGLKIVLVLKLHKVFLPEVNGSREICDLRHSLGEMQIRVGEVALDK